MKKKTAKVSSKTKTQTTKKKTTVAAKRKVAPTKTKKVVAKKAPAKKVVKATPKKTVAKKAPAKKTTVSRAAPRATAQKSTSGNGLLVFLVIVLVILGVAFVAMSNRRAKRDRPVEVQQDVVSMSNIVGIFEAELPAAAGPGRLLTLEFADDQSVVFMQDYQNNMPAIVETGVWNFVGNRAISVALNMRGDAYLEEEVLMTFAYDNGRLTLLDHDVATFGSDGLVLTRVGMELDGTLQLSSDAWVWNENSEFTLEFTANDNMLFVGTDCNNGRSSYVVTDDGGLTFSPIAATMMLCIDSQEGEFFEALNEVVSYEIDGSTLTLGLADGNTMTFTNSGIQVAF
ncbi:MAG: META domain-containing protein [Pseudomonadales bacterium]|jgi:heat shock protein HslJ|nr:META domain-containing protein [Pseudomonadales bacterium]